MSAALGSLLDPNAHHRIHRQDCGYRGFCDCGAARLSFWRKVARIAGHMLYEASRA